MPPGPSVAIVTDSTADLPPELVARYGIHVVPQTIIWGGQTYRDRVDMDSPAFYARLRTDREFPKTSQPAPGTFREVWQQAAPDPAQPILSIHVSSLLSGTVSTADSARELLPEHRITILDTRTATLALGYIVLAAARAAATGAGVEGCLAAARALVAPMNLLLLVDTLEYLHRGGRIGGAQRLVGTMLNLKPLLEVRGGKIEPLERVRTRTKGLARLLEVAAERAKDQRLRVGVLHVNAPGDAEQLARDSRARFQVEELIVSEATPAIGAHVGPGTLGLVFYPVAAEQQA